LFGQQQTASNKLSHQQQTASNKLPSHQLPTIVPITQEQRLNETNNLKMLMPVYYIIYEELIAQHQILLELNLDWTKSMPAKKILVHCSSMIYLEIPNLKLLSENYKKIGHPEKDLISKYAEIIQNILKISKELEKVVLCSYSEIPISIHDPSAHIQKVQLLAKTLQVMSGRAIFLAENGKARDMDISVQDMVW